MDTTQLNSPSELRKALGIVNGTKRKPGRPAKPKVLLPGTEASSILPTFATDTAQTEILENPLGQSLSVSGTNPNLVPFMAWEVTPIGYVESGSPRITDEQWASLPSSWQAQLELLAHGRGEDPRDTIAIIAEHYSETDLADWDLTDCISFYLVNEII